VLSAYISLLEVLPEYQGRGIGSEVMRRLLKQLDGLYMVDTLCDVDVQAFYARFGMRRATGMLIRRYDRIPGGETGG
jgi:ribosomal protein S18 acetylase RimI-like enzyme